MGRTCKNQDPGASRRGKCGISIQGKRKALLISRSIALNASKGYARTQSAAGKNKTKPVNGGKGESVYGINEQK